MSASFRGKLCKICICYFCSLFLCYYTLANSFVLEKNGYTCGRANSQKCQKICASKEQIVSSYRHQGIQCTGKQIQMNKSCFPLKIYCRKLVHPCLINKYIAIEINCFVWSCHNFLYWQSILWIVLKQQKMMNKVYLYQCSAKTLFSAIYKVTCPDDLFLALSADALQSSNGYMRGSSVLQNSRVFSRLPGFTSTH